jgi:abhydrolase domain-containing protein 17
MHPTLPHTFLFLPSGSASQRNCYAGIDAVFNYLLLVRNVAPENIILYGRSMGSGPSCYLARRLAKEGIKLGGLILHAPFTSVYRVVLPDLGFGYLGDVFPNIDRIDQVQCPIFIAHGKDDNIVPFSHGQALLQKISPKQRPHFFTHPDMHHNHFEGNAEAALFVAMNHFINTRIRIQVGETEASLQRLIAGKVHKTYEVY